MRIGKSKRLAYNAVDQVVVNRPCTLLRVIVNDANSDLACNIYNETTTAKTASALVADIDGNSITTLEYGVFLSAGLTVELGGSAGSVTVVWE